MGQIERSSLQIVLKESPCIIRSRNTTILIIEPYNIIKWYHFFLIQKRRKSHDYFSREQRGSIECSSPSEGANESPCIMGSKNTIILITEPNDIIKYCHVFLMWKKKKPHVHFSRGQRDQIECSSPAEGTKESSCPIGSKNTRILITEPNNIIRWYHVFLIRKRRKPHVHFSKEQVFTFFLNVVFYV